MSLFNGNPVSVTKGVHILPMEEQIVQVKPWNEIKSPEKADTVRLEPSMYNFHVMEALHINYHIGRDLLRDLQAEVQATQGTVSLF